MIVSRAFAGTVLHSSRKGRMKPCVGCGSLVYVQRCRDEGSKLDQRKYCTRACYTAYRRSPGYIEGQFWAKVQKGDGCWLWTGRLMSAGYGEMRPTREFRVLAHRYSYTLANGPIPKGQLVLHSCDTPLCVRPDHLSLGTDADNHADMIRRDRHPRGERGTRHKLTQAQVVEIRGLKGKLTQKEIAEKYGLYPSYVWQLLNRRAWKHVA